MATPRARGFHIPAEWEEHAACLIGWTCRKGLWPEEGTLVQRVIMNVIRAICQYEKVLVVAREGTFHIKDYEELAVEIAENRVEICPLPCDDVWLRDSGPTFVVNDDRSEINGVCWNFNAWGGIVRGFERDKALAAAVCRAENHAVYRAPLVCEGGALAFDGEGTLITTTPVLLDVCRNGGTMSKEDIEGVLMESLGVRKVIWLPEGVAGDDTKGHVDNVVAFVKPGEVVLTWTDDQEDEQHATSVRAERILMETTDAQGRRLKVHRLHQPDKIIEDYWNYSKRLPASYVNFYIANKAVIVPQFGQPKWDQLALNTLRPLFPGRDIIGVQSAEIRAGNIHCITQQVPKTKGEKTRNGNGERTHQHRLDGCYGAF